MQEAKEAVERECDRRVAEADAKVAAAACVEVARMKSHSGMSGQ